MLKTDGCLTVASGVDLIKSILEQITEMCDLSYLYGTVLFLVYA